MWKIAFLFFLGSTQANASDWLDLLKGRFSSANLECFDKQKKENIYVPVVIDFTQEAPTHELKGSLSLALADYSFALRMVKTPNSQSHSLFLEYGGRLIAMSATDDDASLSFKMGSGQAEEFNLIFSKTQDREVVMFGFRKSKLPLPGTIHVCTGELALETRN